MKTFLHYTKQKELDEGLAGFVGSAIRGIVKGTDTAKAIGGELNKGIGGLVGVAKMGVERAETQIKEKGQFAKEKADCVRRLDYYQNLLTDARTSGNNQKEKKYIADIKKIKAECAAVMKSSTYDALAKQREAEDTKLIGDFDAPVAGKKGFDKYG